MSLTHRFRMVLAIQIALGVGVAILLISLVQNQNDLRLSADAHHQASLLADELRQSSDDLTRMARSYVVTGDARFERDYRTILDIRNGRRPRPVDYHRVYWDLVLPGRPDPRPAGVTTSMQDMMATQNLTATEREMLSRAQRNSDALARIEEIALQAVKGKFADATGAFTVRGAPNRALATRLMNDAAYFERKAAIMAPIDTFSVLLERRTAAQVSADERHTMLLLQSLGVFLVTILGAFLYSFLTLRRQLAARERSERKRATTAALLERTGAVARVGGWELDLRTMAHFWSAETCRILEIDPPIAPPLDEGINFYVPEHRPIISAAVQAAIDDGTSYDVELTALTAKGRRIYVRAQGVAVREDGRTVKLQGALQDITERRAAEHTLRLMRASVDAASDALFWMTPDARIIQVNDAACRSLGYTRDELLALRVPDVDAHFNDDVWRTHFPALQAAGSLTFESEQRAKDGRLIPVEIVANYVRFGEEEFNCAFVRDITARKRADAALREGEARTRAIMQSAPDAIITLDHAGAVLAWNASAETMFGRTEAEMLGQALSMVMPERYRQQHRTGLDRVASGGAPHAIGRVLELSGLRVDGTEFPLELSLSRWESSRGWCTTGILRDTTARWQAAAALQASEAQMGQAFGASPIGMGLVSLEGRYLKVNPALCAMLGRTEAELLALDFQAVTHPDDVAASVALSQEMIDGARTSYEIEKRYRRTDGSELLAQLNVSLVRDAAGVPVHFVAQVQDITARNEAARNLSESEDRFRSLVANAPYCIHEIDLAGRLTAMNAAGLVMMGVDNESAIQGMPYLDAVGDRDRDRIAGLLTAALAGQRAEFVFQGSTGLAFQSSFSPIADKTGRVRRLMGVTIDITAQKQEEAVDVFLAQAGMIAGGESFFLALARFLAESLRTDYVCIDRLEGDALNATTLAVWHDGQFDDNLTYALNDTPCADVVGQKVCCYPANVSRLFPNDAALQALRAESYIGVTLWSHAGEPIGLIAVIGRQPLDSRAHAETTLARVAPRAAGELERLIVEEKLRASDAHARALIDASPAPMALNDEAEHVTYVNPAFVRTFGYTREDIPTLADWWPKAYPDAAYRQQVADAWHAELARSVRTGTAFEPQELAVRCKDGTERFVVVHVTSMSHGGVQDDLVIFHDITARRRVEAAHRLGSAALQAVANAVVITDRAGVIVWANSAFTASTGFTTDEAIGRMPGELLKSGAHDAAFYRALWDTILAGDVWRGEMSNQKKDGSRFLEEMTITPLVDLSGAITHFIAVKQEVTQRKALEFQLQQAQKMESVGLLAGGVAHDFNNMLGVILGTTELAIAQVDAAQPLHEDLLEIRKAALRSADLTRQLLAFARKQTIIPTVLDLNETVPEMLAMLQRLIGEDISLHWQPTAVLWPVMMDPSQMDQILTNLCVNARHAIADVGTVTIATANVVADAAFCSVHAEAVPGDYVQLSVRDTGSGMDAVTQARIFEPFFSTKGVGQGTGLGLATVYGAVKQNQGFVTVTSTLGEGTTFEIYLPRHRGARAPARLSGAVVADLRGDETILVVEDEPALIRLTTKVLEEQGYVVLTASNGADALRLASARAGEIHLLLSDVVMPAMNGRDLAAALRKLRPTLKLLFMSGHPAGIIASRSLLPPELALIEKPFTPVALASRVREVLDAE